MKKENKTKDELDILLESMKAENSMPDKDFEEELRYEVLKKFGKKFSASRGFLGIKWNFGLVVILLLFVATGIIGAQTISYIFGDNPGTSKSVVLSGDQTQEFLTNVIDNNSQDILNTNLEAVQDSASTDGGGVVLPVTDPTDNIITLAEVEKQKELAISAEKSYSFSKTITTYYNGPAVDRCEIFSGSENMVTEASEYVDKETETYYFKYISKDSDGDLIDYYLDSEKSFVTYFGGKYAIEELKKPPIVEETHPDAAENASGQPLYTEEDLVNSYFADAQVAKKGENYTITYTSAYNCGSGENPDLKTVLNVSEVKGINFSFLEHNTYLEEVSDENLLNGYKYDLVKEDKTEEELSQIFAFEYEAELKDIGEFTMTYSERHKDLMNYLKTNEVKLLTAPRDEDLNLTYATYYELDSIKKNYTYLADRDFYADSEKGDLRYGSVKDDSDTIGNDPGKFSVFFSLTSANLTRSYYLTYYPESTDSETILAQMGFSSLDAVIQTETISIDENEVDITVFTFPEDTTSAYSIFEFDGNKVLMGAYNFGEETEFDLFLKELQVLDMTDRADLDLLDSTLGKQFEDYKDEIYWWGD